MEREREAEGERPGDEREEGRERERDGGWGVDLNRNRMFVTAPVNPPHITQQIARLAGESACVCVRACVSKCVCVYGIVVVIKQVCVCVQLWGV